MANSKKNRSHVDKDGHAYYKHVGRYNEVLNTFPANVGTIFSGDGGENQKNLANPSPDSAAASTLKAVWGELGW